DGYYQSEAAVAYGRAARWAVQGTALYQINPKLGIAAGLEYRSDLVVNGALLPAGFGAPAAAYFSDGHAWAAQVGINWQPVQNFLIGADVTYNKEKVELVDLAGNHWDARQDSTRF